jgi:hypothetical protein
MAQLGFQQGLAITFEHLLLVENLAITRINQNVQVVTGGDGLDAPQSGTFIPWYLVSVDPVVLTIGRIG